MFTRCTTHFKGSGADVAIIYRHGDGYPDGHGTDLLAFLKECAKLRDPRFEDPPYLAAKLVVWLANAFRSPQAPLLEFISVGVMMEDPGDIAYMYTVDCGEGEWPSVRCFEVGGEEVPIPGNFTLGEIKRENRSILHPKSGRCYDLAGDYNSFQDGHIDEAGFFARTGMTVEQYETRAHGNPAKNFDYYEAGRSFYVGRHGGRYIGRHDESLTRRQAVRKYGTPIVSAGEESARNFPFVPHLTARGNPESTYTISRFDIGRPTIRAFGKVWLTQNFIGRILPRDVGKKVYLRDDILQVENDEQFNRRRAATGLTRFNDTSHRY